MVKSLTINIHCACGIPLDGMLASKQHIKKLKKKVNSRICVLQKLASTKWEADPITLPATSLTVCHSAAQYYGHGQARHTKLIMNSLNPVDSLHGL